MPTRRPRVLLVAHDVQLTGGMESACAELIERAADRIDFTIVSATLAPELRGLVRWHRIPVIARPFPLKFVGFFILAGLRLLTVPRDVVHTVGAIIPNRIDLATVHMCHAAYVRLTRRLAPPDLPLFRRINWAVSRLLALAAERWCYRPGRAGLLAAVSPQVEEQLHRHFSKVPARLTPNGVDIGRFTGDTRKRQEFRARHGVGPDDFVALFVGGAWEHKGLPLAIRAMPLMSAYSGKRMYLWIVGRGDRERYQRLADDLEVGHSTRFFGPQREVAPFYQAADALVLPSLYETFSLAALEAAACGTPVVATPVGCLAALIGSEEAGILIERTPESVAMAIVRLAESPELRDQLGRTARERAAAYSWERSAESVLGAYAELLQRPMVDSAIVAARGTVP